MLAVVEDGPRRRPSSYSQRQQRRLHLHDELRFANINILTSCPAATTMTNKKKKQEATRRPTTRQRPRSFSLTAATVATAASLLLIVFSAPPPYYFFFNHHQKLGVHAFTVPVLNITEEEAATRGNGPLPHWGFIKKKFFCWNYC
jgi:hypothetical protein